MKNKAKNKVKVCSIGNGNKYEGMEPNRGNRKSNQNKTVKTNVLWYHIDIPKI
jgi:hypothetical protein